MAQVLHLPVPSNVINPMPVKRRRMTQQKKPDKCPLGKVARRRLWAHLRQYCEELFASGLPLTQRFDPPQHALEIFSQLGLRHPRNPRALRKFYDNFIPKCGHLPENDNGDLKSRKPRQWKAKPGSPPSIVTATTAFFPPLPPSPSPSNQVMQPMQPMQLTQPVEALLGAEQQMAETVQKNEIWRWLASNCYDIATPPGLHGVRIYRSNMRSDGLNILSMDYSNRQPKPTQKLQAFKRMIVFAAQNDAEKYTNDQSQLCLADPLFCQEMVEKRMLFVPIPPCMVGKTLAETPELSEAGIITLSINLQMQHPAAMCKRRFRADDTLICLFNANESSNGLTESALLFWRMLL